MPTDPATAALRELVEAVECEAESARTVHVWSPALWHRVKAARSTLEALEGGERQPGIYVEDETIGKAEARAKSAGLHRSEFSIRVLPDNQGADDE